MLVIAEFNNRVIYLRQYEEINEIVTGLQEGRHYGKLFQLYIFKIHTIKYLLHKTQKIP